MKTMMKNMKKIGAVLLIMTMMLSVFTFASASTAVKTTGRCNLRVGPGLEYSQEITVPKGTKLTVKKTSTDDRGVKWYKVTYDGTTGWISSVNTNKGSSEKTVTATCSVPVRKAANRSATQLTTMKAWSTAKYHGDVKYDERGVAWYKVTYNGTTGWVSTTNTYIG